MTRYTSCEAFADSLADFLERDLAEPARAEMEAHALACADCGSLLADLRKLRIDAANLPVLTPSRDLWSGIAARIDAPVIPLNARHAAGRRTIGSSRAAERWRRASTMVAAAAALIAVTSAVTYFATIRSVGPRSSITTTASAPTETPLSVAVAPTVASTGGDSTPVVTRSSAVASASRPRDVGRQPDASRPSSAARASFASNAPVKSKPSAEVTYDREITRLRTILQQRRAQIDPVTVSIIERNLKVIDDAIAQCRAALAKDPASRFLIESLNNALENKLELMRTAAMLPSRT